MGTPFSVVRSVRQPFCYCLQVTVAVYPERTDAMNGAGIRRINCDRIACREGHFERLVETRIERLFGLGFLGHAA